MLVVLGALLPATLLGSTPPDPGQAPAHNSLAGQLLIASPAMGDPRFAQTVIFMVRHDRSGALGIVINRPVGERPFATLLEALGESAAEATGNARIFVGGPVQTEAGFILHSAEYRQPQTIVIDTRFALTSSRAAFRDLATGKGPKQSLIAFGYAGWGPGQLEGELTVGAWHTAPADAVLVFDEDRTKVWERALQRRTRDL
jgi:putative transcriptional regulator